jgi:hypothetical protein
MTNDSLLSNYTLTSQSCFEKEKNINNKKTDNEEVSPLLRIHKQLLPGFPRSILQLKHLTKLIIYHCKLEELPEDIFFLSNLTTLYVSNNSLRSLPSSLGSLSSLRKLSVSYNSISTLPNQLLTLKSLVYLNLNSNPLGWRTVQKGNFLLIPCPTDIPSLRELSRNVLVTSNNCNNDEVSKKTFQESLDFLPEELREYLKSRASRCASCAKVLCFTRFKLVIPKRVAVLRRIPRLRCEVMFSADSHPAAINQIEDNEDGEGEPLDTSDEEDRPLYPPALPFDFHVCSELCARNILQDDKTPTYDRQEEEDEQ